MVKMMAMKISVNFSGIALYKNGKLKEISAIKGKGKDKMYSMVKEINFTLNSIKPNMIAIEFPSLTKKTETQKKHTMMIYGSVYSWAVVHGCDFIELCSTEWKMWCCKGTDIDNSRKEKNLSTIDAAKKIYPKLTFETEEVAESALIGLAHINRSNAKIKGLPK